MKFLTSIIILVYLFSFTLVNADFNRQRRQCGNEDVGKRLPNKRVCGRQHSDDYFHTINGTSINQFPWVALIEYPISNINYSYSNRVAGRYQCTGSLINSKYVLTAANCIIYQIPYKVRLGEYHISNETDCVLDSRVLECAEVVQDFYVEKAIAHKDYTYKEHDIGLVRLKGTVVYSDYIRPICLPLPGIKRADFGDTLTTTGWGREGNTEVDIKKIALSRFATNEECENRIRKNLYLSERLVCSLLKTNETACSHSGDLGGPVMFSHRGVWVQEGVVTFGEACHDAASVLFIKVDYYMDWIIQNLEE